MTTVPPKSSNSPTASFGRSRSVSKSTSTSASGRSLSRFFLHSATPSTGHGQA